MPTPGGVVQRSRADIMGDRPSNDTPSNRQLENRRVNAAGVKAPGLKHVATIGRAGGTERERERKYMTVHKKLLSCLIFQDIHSAEAIALRFLQILSVDFCTG